MVCVDSKVITAMDERFELQNLSEREARSRTEGDRDMWYAYMIISDEKWGRVPAEFIRDQINKRACDIGEGDWLYGFNSAQFLAIAASNVARDATAESLLDLVLGCSPSGFGIAKVRRMSV